MLHTSATHEQEARATVFALCRALFVTFSRIEKVKIKSTPPSLRDIASFDQRGAVSLLLEELEKRFF